MKNLVQQIFLCAALIVVSIPLAQAQEITYSSTFDLSFGATFTGNTFGVTGEEFNPTDIVFNPDGTKMFIVGLSGREVNQYSLTTPFDISSGVSFDGSPFSVSIEETSPQGIAFSTDGTKMFIIGQFSRLINQYSLTTPFDITSGVSSDGSPFDFLSEENNASGIAFDPSGIKMFIVGFGGDEVNQYSLTTPFDITSGVSFDGSPFSVSSEDATPQGIAFNMNGTKMFIVGSTDDEVNAYSLITPYDITSGVTFDGSPFSIAGEETTPTGMAFNTLDSKMFIIGRAGGDVSEYDISTSNFVEGDLNDGSVDGAMTILITGETFTNTGGTLSGSDYTVTNLPTGLTSVLDVATDGKLASLTLGGSATDHQDIDDVADLQFTFANSAFLGGNAAGVTNAVAASSNLGIDFNDNNPSLTYGYYFDVTNGATFSGSFGITSEEGRSQGLAFSTDGMKMFIVGQDGDDVNQYSLTTPFDVTTGVSFDGSPFSVVTEASFVQAIAFNTTGTKMFIVDSGPGRLINQYSLTSPFDITSGASFDGSSFSVGSEELGATGIAFSADGMKMFIVGATGDEVNQYSLTTPFDITSGVSFDGSPFSVESEDAFPTDIAFNADGTKMYMLGATADEVNQYSLSTPFDITSGVTFDGNPLDVTTEETAPSGLAFSPDGTKMFIVGSLSDRVNQYELNIGGFTEVEQNDGSVDGSITVFVTDEIFSNAGGDYDS